jgi:hypothetical protein
MALFAQELDCFTSEEPVPAWDRKYYYAVFQFRTGYIVKADFKASHQDYVSDMPK